MSCLLFVLFWISQRLPRKYLNVDDKPNWFCSNFNLTDEKETSKREFLLVSVSAVLGVLLVVVGRWFRSFDLHVHQRGRFLYFKNYLRTLDKSIVILEMTRVNILRSFSFTVTFHYLFHYNLNSILNFDSSRFLETLLKPSWNFKFNFLLKT